MMNSEERHPASPQDIARRLGKHGLRIGVVDPGDASASAAWNLADARGFHEPTPSPERLAELFEKLAYRRSTGVWDDTALDPASPVATVSSWATRLSTPGGEVPAWAISSVTVASTHRRRGIARGLLEGELATASAEGLPIAILTASEATIYGRFGFAPASLSADWSIDTSRAHWRGEDVPGRVHFVTPEQLRADDPAIVERARLRTPGEIEHWDLRRDERLGLAKDSTATPTLRGIRYDDENGVPQGYALYTITAGSGHLDPSVLDVTYLTAATDDAYAALWRLLFEMDLVTEVRAKARSVDEPFRWLLTDVRAASKTYEDDRLWVRILDVPAALAARTYAADSRIGFELTDVLGYARGQFLLTVDADGAGSAERVEGDLPAGVPVVALGINELASLYLGGVRAATLARAGRIAERTPDAVAAVDRAFDAPTAPWLSIIF